MVPPQILTTWEEPFRPSLYSFIGLVSPTDRDIYCSLPRGAARAHGEAGREEQAHVWVHTGREADFSGKYAKLSNSAFAFTASSLIEPLHTELDIIMRKAI